jgi:hypothetical protein
MMEAAKLCYVEGNWAFFTTAPLDAQTGDDWDDAPYQYNAERPYGSEHHEVIQVAWKVPNAYRPEDVQGTDWSVDQINAGAVAWIFSASWAEEPWAIPAGTTLDDFIVAIKRHGGQVYTEA